MSVELGKLVADVKQKIDLSELSNKTVAIDAYNTIYQFLSIIRQPDGTPLKDSKGNVTSHLSGLFYRVTNLLEARVEPVFVFDGMPPVLKQRTIQKRIERREEALSKWEKAKKEGMIEEARTHAMASTRITKQIVEDSKRLLGFMGIPYIQAPSEGEAQAAQLVSDGLAYASSSQDYDSFLFGANIVIRNLTITGKRKLPGKNIYINVDMERIFLKDLLKKLEINQRQLIWLGMLMGTDFNEGISGVGPKTALKIVKEKKSIGEVFDFVKSKYGVELDYDVGEVERVFTEPEVMRISDSKFNEVLKNAKPDKNMLLRFLCDEHDFSLDRATKFAEKIMELKGQSGQKGINNWLG